MEVIGLLSCSFPVCRSNSHTDPSQGVCWCRGAPTSEHVSQHGARRLDSDHFTSACSAGELCDRAPTPGSIQQLSANISSPRAATRPTLKTRQGTQLPRFKEPSPLNTQEEIWCQPKHTGGRGANKRFNDSRDFRASRSAPEPTEREAAGTQGHLCSSAGGSSFHVSFKMHKAVLAILTCLIRRAPTDRAATPPEASHLNQYTGNLT